MRSVVRAALPALLAGLTLCAAPAGANAGEQRSPHIVVLKDSVERPARVAARHAQNRGAQITHLYSHALKGYAAMLGAADVRALRKDPAVEAVGPDPRGELAGQVAPNPLKRTFATANSQIGINGVDDRVDVDIAILDTGIAYDPDLNVVARTNCFGADSAPQDETPGDYANCKDGEGRSFVPADPEALEAHGTMVARVAAAIDNDLGDPEGPATDVGIAPGARLWSVQVANLEVKDPPHPETTVEAPFYMSDVIAGVDWVTQHASEIEVANMSMHFEAPSDPAGKAIADALEDAISDSIEAGVVYVVAAGNEEHNVSSSIPARFPAVITASAIYDNDGKAGKEGGSGTTCLGKTGDEDDTSSKTSNFGTGVDIAAPGNCTSNASALTAGAAALLASKEGKNPEDAGDVETIGKELFGKSNCASPSEVGEGNCNWTDESKDGVKEPLLDVSDSVVFDPKMDLAPTPQPASADVNGDDRSDLVTLRNNGVGYVHPGGGDAKFGAGTSSFSDGKGGGILDPALYDGSGFHVIDVASATKDDYADMITVYSNGTVYLAPGSAGKTFGSGPAVITSLVEVLKPPLAEGGHEPIGVADVGGDGKADLLAYDDAQDALKVYPGDGEGHFETAKVARTGVDSALHDTLGEYFVDLADVTGEGRADLVSITADGDLRVYRGQEGGTFATPVSSQQGKVKPAMANSSGLEPVGLADVDADGRADLVLSDAADNTIYVYQGNSDATMGSAIGVPVASFGPDTAMKSSTFQAGYFELDLLDVDGDGHADLRGVLLNGTTYVWRGLPGGAFSRDPVQSSGSFPSTQHSQNLNSSGNQFVTEQPSWRRRGCSLAGCNQKGWLSARGTESPVLVKSAATGKACGHVTQSWTTISGGCVIEDFATPSYQADVPVPGQTVSMYCDGIEIEALHVDQDGWFAAAPEDVHSGDCDFWVYGEKASADPCPSHEGKTSALLSNPWSGFLFRNKAAGIAPSIWLSACMGFAWEEFQWAMVDALWMELDSASPLETDFMASQAQLSGGGEAWGYEVMSEDWDTGAAQGLALQWGP